MQLGLICSTAKLHQVLAVGAIALTVVVTDPNRSTVWFTAGARFIDVALGIAVALLVVKAWPHRKDQS